jgi:hypothetical protein
MTALNPAPREPSLAKHKGRDLFFLGGVSFTGTILASTYNILILASLPRSGHQVSRKQSFLPNIPKAA